MYWNWNNASFFGADWWDSAPSGRPSLRLEGIDTYTEVLIIADFAHLPGTYLLPYAVLTIARAQFSHRSGQEILRRHFGHLAEKSIFLLVQIPKATINMRIKRLQTALYKAKHRTDGLRLPIAPPVSIRIQVVLDGVLTARLMDGKRMQREAGFMLWIGG